ncbi:MAG: nicotinamide mononucleotide transporter [Verrucomicrobia bacterium]|nr:nicotinamide mononucleotide transporter [Verrucomicrobiota bacterium]
MREVFHAIREGFASGTPLDQLNLVLNVAGVWLMIRRSLWAFPVGLAAVTVQGVLFVQARFPADATLQVFYFLIFAWGWRRWLQDRGATPELPVTRLGIRGRILTIAAAGVATAVWALAIGPWMKAAMPWRDAFIAAFSVAAQILQVRRNIENWPVWIVVNVVAVASYWSAALAYTAFLYAIFFVMAFIGWREWRRAMKGAVPCAT